MAVTVGTAIIVAIIAAFLPLAEIAALANAGTLCAFVAVGASMLILRKREPDRARAFRTPAAPLVGAVAILGCLYLFWNLPLGTQLRFFGWNALGLLVYFAYARRRSVAGGMSGIEAADFGIVEGEPDPSSTPKLPRL